MTVIEKNRILQAAENSKTFHRYQHIDEHHYLSRLAGFLQELEEQIIADEENGQSENFKGMADSAENSVGQEFVKPEPAGSPAQHFHEQPHLQEEPHLPADPEEADDYEPGEATVLFAIPGRGVRLMEEDEAMERFPELMEGEEYSCNSIGENLTINYLLSNCFKHEGRTTVLGPVYIARIPEYEIYAEELTARDFITAMNFLNTHTTHIIDENGRKIHGYWISGRTREE